MFEQRVTLHAIYSSPEHNYFTRPRFEIGNAPTISHENVTLQPGRGIDGDRFEDSRYPLTFFSLEVAEAVAAALKQPTRPELFRRNLLVSGVNLGELIGERFRIGDVLFEGISHCAPCTWMNAALGEGAYRLLRGRGGLRASVLEGGALSLGEQVLISDKPLRLPPEAPLSKPKLPKEKP